MKIIFALAAGLLLSRTGLSAGTPERTATEQRLLEVFPKTEFAQVGGGRCTFSQSFAPTDSLWAEGLDERQVFQVEMKHVQDADSSFALRVGRGGQIYSLRGAFGESVPPSWRESNDKKSPWNDEVWQFVAVCTKYNGVNELLRAGPLPDDVVARLKSSAYAQTYFIHNSGAYIPGGAAIPSLYCPQLAAAFADDGHTYRTLNWGLVPQVRTIHRSPVLFHTQLRDAGDGVIELTWVVHNFSTREDVVFNHLNAPWGGTRATSLPEHFVGATNGAVLPREQVFGKDYDGAIEARKTGGWSIACVSEAVDSPSLALVFGRDRHLDEELQHKREGREFVQNSASVIRNFRAGEPMYSNRWKDWRTRPANDFRNYDVIEMIPRILLKPGRSVWFRSYLVVNRKDRAIELAKSLVDKVDYGSIAFDAATTPLLPVSVRDGRIAAAGRQIFELYSRPVPGSQPLFLIENTQTGREVVTTDPYIFVQKEPLDFGLPSSHPAHDYFNHAFGYSMDANNSRWKGLLGYALVAKPASGNFARLSTLLDASHFPKPDEHHLDVWVKTAGP